MLLIIAGLVVVVLGAGGGLFLMSRKGKDNLPSIEINIGNSTEDEDVTGSVYVVAAGPGASLNGVIRLSGQDRADHRRPRRNTCQLRPAARRELRVPRRVHGPGHPGQRSEAYRGEAVRDLRGGARGNRRRAPLTCAEGEAVQAKVTLTNVSRHPAVFDTFVLNPGEARDFLFDVDTSVAGKGEKKVTITFKNKAGRNYTTEALIKYTVQSAAPDIEAVVEPLEVAQDEKGLAKVVLTNVSDFVAVFDNFTLKKGDSRTLEYMVDGKAIGEAVATMPISFRNLIGRRFDLQIPVRYRVYAMEPAIEVRAESVELAGGQGFVLASPHQPVPLRGLLRRVHPQDRGEPPGDGCPSATSSPGRTRRR